MPEGIVMMSILKGGGGKVVGYHEEQRNRALRLRDELFADLCGGWMRGKPREHVLSDASVNLWAGFREGALAYFRENHIWWEKGKSIPSGNLLSSQVACVNHLFVLRDRKDLATSVLKGIDSKIEEAAKIDSGYIEFEYGGKRDYLGDQRGIRGAWGTWADCAMLGRRSNGCRVFVLVEWKYIETYSRTNFYLPNYAVKYDPLIMHERSPFVNADPKVFYFQPFFQMMRQTLLGWKFAESHDHGCGDYLNVHVIPNGNLGLRLRVTSPLLHGNNITEAWKSTLKEPEKYISVTPESFLRPCVDGKGTEGLMSYLSRRYW